jgi:hypothetical protein
VKKEGASFMSGLEPIYVPALSKALDFLFNQAGKLMEERRNAKKARGEEVASPTAQVSATTREEVNSWQPKKVYLSDFPEEVEHCLVQIEQFRLTKRLLEDKVSIHGGFRLAPTSVQHELSIAEEEIKRWCEKLKALVEEVYGQKIIIVGLS